MMEDKIHRTKLYFEKNILFYNRLNDEIFEEILEKIILRNQVNEYEKCMLT